MTRRAQLLCKWCNKRCLIERGQPGSSCARTSFNPLLQLSRGANKKTTIYFNTIWGRGINANLNVLRTWALNFMPTTHKTTTTNTRKGHEQEEARWMFLRVGNYVSGLLCIVSLRASNHLECWEGGFSFISYNDLVNNHNVFPVLWADAPRHF